MELLKQEENRLERKRLKKERKLAKKKRREEEDLVSLFSLLRSEKTVYI